MVQHVRIKTDPINSDRPLAHPHVVSVWRDDQTIKWGLDEGWCWPNGVAQPIIFLAPDPSKGYVAWPGSIPVPIGPAPPAGEPDRRYYTASSDKILDPGSEPEIYHYAYAVCPIDNPNCPLDIITMDRAPEWQRWQDEHGEWHDPETENRPQP